MSNQLAYYPCDKYGKCLEGFKIIYGDGFTFDSDCDKFGAFGIQYVKVISDMWSKAKIINIPHYEL